MDALEYVAEWYTVILAETEHHELQQLVDSVVQESEHKGLFFDRAKSYTMVVNQLSCIHTCQFEVHGKHL